LCGFGLFFGLTLGSVTAAESLDAPRLVHQLLLAGEEGVAGGTDLDVELVLLDRGSGLDDVAAHAHDPRGLINGMDTGFHVWILSVSPRIPPGHSRGPRPLPMLSHLDAGELEAVSEAAAHYATVVEGDKIPTRCGSQLVRH